MALLNAWKFVAAVSLALAATAPHAESGAHAHEHGAAPTTLTLNEGKKWETDAPLRRGMEKIRVAMEAAVHEIHAAKFSNAKYGKLARTVGEEVGGIVANCKLEARADAQLHVVIADLLAGADAMAGKAKPVDRQSGAVMILAALDKYAGHFDHPNWKPLVH